MSDEVTVVGEYKCPNPKCGSSRRLVEDAMVEEKAAGRIPAGAVMAARVDKLEIKDPQKRYGPGDEIAVIVLFWDFCLDCGVDYVYRTEKVMGTIRIQHDPKIVAPPGKLFIPPGLGRMNN